VTQSYWTRAYWILATLLGHWRRHPMNFATLVIGLAIATALWSGVQALNTQARQSYDRAAAVFGNAGARSIVSARGTLFTQDYFLALRRAGFKVSPVLEGTVHIGGKAFRLIGIEPLTIPAGTSLGAVQGTERLEHFLRPPWQTVVSPATSSDLTAAGGSALVTERGHALPPVTAIEDVTPGLLVVDIGVAQTVLERPGQLSRLLLGAGDPARAADVGRLTGDELRVTEPEEAGDLARLTDSFHLNLTAFGFLAFIVGLFIVHASIGLAFEQRLGMIRTMRAVGVPLRLLMAVLVGEILLLALAAGIVGMICGYLIAAALLPDVAASLEGLYGASVGGRLALAPAWWVSGLGMAVLGALAASAAGLLKVAQLPVLAVAHPVAWRQAQARQLRRQGLLAAACFAVALVTYLQGQGLVAGFVIIAGVLLGAALLLPLVFAGLLRAGEQSASNALAHWFWADSRQQLSGLSLALMALLLALSANVGVGTMVEGFRKTFTAWLDERLNSELYFDAQSDVDAARIVDWLKTRPEVSAILPVWRAETRIDTWPVDVFGIRDHATYREHFSLLSQADGAWDRVARGEGVLISEQLARRLHIDVGTAISIPTARGLWRTEAVGIYPDYGNPKGQARVNVDALVAHWPEVRRVNYSLRVEPVRAPQLMADMQDRFSPIIGRIIDQASIKAMSLGIFEKTFAVTAALNTLTLLVSGVALFASLLTLSDLRLAQLAPVWAAGVTRRRLAELEVLKILVLAAVTAVLAVPLGLVLAWCLVAIVNVEAFGWRLPLHIFPSQWALIFALALLTAFLAALVPVVRLARTRPARLLKVFADER
jgi:putative ABC transport system permease protein